MKLEKLIKEREHISTNEFSIPVKELLECYEQLYAGAISDVLREFPYDVLLRAEEIVGNEKVIFEWVAEGQSVTEITEKCSYF